jgi:integrase
MAIRLASNLHRNRHGVLYFRIKVPLDIQDHFPAKEIYRSLRTANIREASDMAQGLSILFKQVFKELRSQHMSESKKTSLEVWNDFKNLPDIRERLKLAGLQVTADQQAAELEQREQLIANLDVQHSQTIERHEKTLRTLDNERVKDISRSLSTLDSADPSKPEVAPSRILSSYIPEYITSINANREKNDWINDQGLGDHRRTCKMLIEIIGDKHLHELSIKDRNRFDDIIKRYPFNREKIQETRGKTLMEILEMPEYKSINLKTAKFHASRANSFLYWTFRLEGLTAPFVLMEDVRIKKGKGAEKKRREFNIDELRILFDVKHFPIHGPLDKQSPYKFWIPLIGLHTGARQNEIAQLRTSDILTIDDIACFNITEETNQKSDEEYLAKSVKTHAAKRLVPIHSTLIELGLLEYLDAVKSQGYQMLFEDLAHAKIKYGALVSKWFATYCERVGLTDKALTFHSFRHGAIGHLRRKRVAKDIRMVVVGHSASEDTHDDYGDIHGDITLTDRQNAIEALDFSDALDFSLLKQRAPTIQQLNAVVSQKKKK